MILENGVLKHTRGDTGGIKVTSIELEDGTPYEMQDGDTLTFTVRQKPTTSSPVLISVSSTTDEITLAPEDTKDVPAGKYSADIQLNTRSGDIFTIWPEKAAPNGKIQPTTQNFENFWIWPEVTAQ